MVVRWLDCGAISTGAAQLVADVVSAQPIATTVAPTIRPGRFDLFTVGSSNQIV